MEIQLSKVTDPSRKYGATQFVRGQVSEDMKASEHDSRHRVNHVSRWCWDFCATTACQSHLAQAKRRLRLEDGET